MISLISQFEIEVENFNGIIIKKKILLKLIDVISSIHEYIYGFSVEDISDLDHSDSFCSISGLLKLRKEKFKNIYEAHQQLSRRRRFVLKEKRFYKKTIPELGSYSPCTIEWKIFWAESEKNKMFIKFEDTTPEIYENEDVLFALSGDKKATREFLDFLKHCVESLKGKKVKFGIFHDDVNISQMDDYDLYTQGKQATNPFTILRARKQLLKNCGAEACLELMESGKIVDFSYCNVFHRDGNDERGDFKVEYFRDKPPEMGGNEEKRYVEIGLGVDLSKNFDTDKVKEKIKQVIILHSKSKEKITKLEDPGLDKAVEKIVKERGLGHWNEKTKGGLKHMLKSGGHNSIRGLFRFVEMEAEEKIKVQKKRRIRK